MTPSTGPGGPTPALGADVAIVGGGLVGLATAAALSARGARITLIAAHHAGEASRAAAGMLAPGVERSTGPAHDFAVAARDLYPSYVEALAEVTGTLVPLDRSGILELAATEEAARAKRAAMPPDAEWLGAAAVHALEPHLAPVAGAVLHSGDGAVDNVALVRTLREFAEASPSITTVDERATALDLEDERPVIHLAAGGRVVATRVVLAAGAWSSTLDGLPRALPVEPVRGQMLGLSGVPVRHVTYGPHGYIVPRVGSTTLVGSTMEHVGFEVGTTTDGERALGAAAAEICPSLASAHVREQWSGLRPMTPDFLPIIGPDPDVPALLYACGHSRNGILLGPLTGECVAALASGEEPAVDLQAFAISRFSR